MVAKVAGKRPEFQPVIQNELQRILRTCVPRDVPTHLESILPALNAVNEGRFLKIVEQRKAEMTPAHLTRLKKVLKTMTAKETIKQ